MKRGNENDLQRWEQFRRGDNTAEEVDPLDKLWSLSDQYGQTFEPDVEAGLRGLKQKIGRQAVVRPIGNNRRWLRIAAAVVGLLGIGYLGLQSLSNTTPEQLAVRTAFGEKRTVLLGDGTKVTLNGDSELLYSSDIASSDVREVSFSGEAYFSVERAPEQPFRITTPRATVQVLGTAFNLKANTGENITTVAVTHGTVALASKTSSEQITLTANEVGVLDAMLQASKVNDDVTSNYHGWRTGRLSFKNTPLRKAIPLIEAYYGIEFVDAEQLLDCEITANWNQLPRQELPQLLETLTGLDVLVKANGKTYHLTGQCQ